MRIVIFSSKYSLIFSGINYHYFTSFNIHPPMACNIYLVQAMGANNIVRQGKWFNSNASPLDGMGNPEH